MSTIKNIRVFATNAHPCSYLPDREATTLFVDPQLPVNSDLYGQLNELGFRRSGKHFYTPHCKNCNNCIATRVVVPDFQLTRRHQRILRANTDVEVIEVDSINSNEHYEIYERYINDRHPDGDMHPPSNEQYKQFIGDATQFSSYLELRADTRLFGVCVLDRLPDGFSAIYTFFDPAFEKRSPGVLAILKLIARAQEQSLDYVYLGYWIRECRKMAYKIEYRPIELLINGRWQRLL